MPRFSEAIESAFGKIEAIHNRKRNVYGLPTGIHDLDDLTGGLEPGHLYVVGGRPSMGKTSLLMLIAENVAVRERKRVLFFSTELDAARLAQEMICSYARVDYSLLKAGVLSEEDFQKVILATGAFHEAEIQIFDHSRPSLKDLFAAAKAEHERRPIDLIIVDYMNMMNIASDLWSPETRYPEVTRISTGLKALSKEFKVPVVVAAQLNRDPERREYRRAPYLWDLRDSGAIEEDADIVMLLHREEYYDPSTEKKGLMEIVIAKNRSGPVGYIDVAFIKQYRRIENLAAARPR